MFNHGRIKGDVNTLSDEFRSHVLAALAYYSFVPPTFTVRQLVEQ